MTVRVLVVAPHPDDETLGCGGSIARHADEGDEVSILSVVRREPTATQLGRDQDDDDELLRAAAVLGAHLLEPLNLDSRSVLDHRRALVGVVRALRRIRPQIVYIPHAEESDQEHRAVNEITREALWIASSTELMNEGIPCESPQVVLGYEVWTPLAHPALIRDIAPTLSRKLEAIAEYRSQDTHALQRAASGLAAYRGGMFGSSSAAEAFGVVMLSNRLLLQVKTPEDAVRGGL